MTIRTRFAPSPTGYLHIGGVRTALFSYLYARRHNGQFVLRIEDTDRVRSTAESVDIILQGMDWLGLQPDEGPFYQSQRFDRYGEVLAQLLDSGDAYRCYCTREELDARRADQIARKQNPRYDGRCRNRTEPAPNKDHVLRFRNPQEGEVVINDLVQGNVVFSNAELDDLIIARTDGTPTYNFCVVVDDIDMRISHVIRGDDHLNNTPRQINIMRALGWEPPAYAHVPMILGPDGGRLSKRHGAVNVLEYRKQGYLPDALLNYLVRLGWSHGDQEVFSMQQMIELFDTKDVNKSASSFDIDKLSWLNQQYIKQADADEVATALAEQFQILGIATSEGPTLNEVVGLFRERAKTALDMATSSRFLFRDYDEFNAKAVRKFLKPEALPVLAWLRQKLSDLSSWDDESIDAVVQSCMAEHDAKMGAVAQPLRVAISGNSVTPSIVPTLTLIGQARALRGIDRAIAHAQG